MNELQLLFGSRYILALAAVMLLLIVIFFVLNISLLITGRRYRALMRGVQGGNLEDLLRETKALCQKTDVRLGELEEEYRKLVKVSSSSVQRVGLVRFNAFADMGSELSFALALLNQLGDGVVICCLTGRDDCRVYAKPVVGGKSTYPLNGEEKEAIALALRSGAGPEGD